jgi:son of sevenless-like protein
MDMFFQNGDDDFTMDESTTFVRRGSLTYEEIVKDLILEETQYMRDLNLIIKVFRTPFATLFPRSKVCNVVVMELYQSDLKQGTNFARIAIYLYQNM